MAESFDAVTEPIPISLISGRYLLFDVDVVTYLRRTHHICGALLGSIPQAPQQNVFLGLPVQLLPEEAKILVEKEVAYIVDDTAWHSEWFGTLQGAERKKYLESLRSEGLKASKAQATAARQRSQIGIARQAVLRATKRANQSSRDASADDPSAVPESDTTETTNGDSNIQEEENLFSDDRPASPTPSKSSQTIVPYAITPTITCSPSSLPQNPSQQPDPAVPYSYPLFAHLHTRNYFIMPGLRFGCDYNVYPGDPLRFHSHFLATGYKWNQDIPMLDLIGGGRLGTGVKKGFLIGGENTDSESEGNNVRTFVVEWAGM
ncbi:hypothetical protein G7Y89_g3996 [Cudoniella acicularis]|uniref:tRNA-splicing endonuclease subunit Sen34 n=1 Tax=Cudoniella acicularis TaxID=354080 RepID=A0A8H4RSD3_9HELO|nr:hypothetical protein G7Y89_g3996 [Cudoniella acicularis]